MDRYPSVLDNLAQRRGPLEDATLTQWFEEIFRGRSEILDVRPGEQKERLFRAKEEVWTKFGYTPAYLDAMKSQSFWDAEYQKIEGIDEALLRARAVV
jgi:hypothetical protein